MKISLGDGIMAWAAFIVFLISEMYVCYLTLDVILIPLTLTLYGNSHCQFFPDLFFFFYLDGSLTF